MGIFPVLAVLVAVAVAGVTISANLQRQPPLEVVVDMPPPAGEMVVERKTEQVPELVAEGRAVVAPDHGIAEAPESDTVAAGDTKSFVEAEAGVAEEPADVWVEDVPEIDTAAGSDEFDETPSPNPVPENAAARTEATEEVAAPAIEVSDGVQASNEADGDGVGTAAEPPPRDDLNNLAATVVEPSMEETRSSVTSTYDGPTPLFGAVVISRRSNLRAEPGPDSPVLAKLNPGQRVFRLDDNPVLGYYRVSSEGVVGWIWWLNVRDGPGGNIQG